MICSVAALDCIADERETLYEDMESHFDDLEQSRDHHPAVDDRYIEVFVGGNHQDCQGLLHVSTDEYFARLL